MSGEEAKLGTDVFLALAAVGWADGKLDGDEADAIVRAALDEGLDLEEIAAIELATKEPVSIQSIDMSKMTKADRLFVYAVASWISRIDGVIADDEQTALEELGAALKIPERPREHADKIVVEIGHDSESDAPAFYNLPKLRRTLKVRLAQAQQLRSAKNADNADDAKGESA